MSNTNVERKIEEIESAYNPEFDLLRGGPPVTWAEILLVEIIKTLIQRIAVLEERIASQTPTVFFTGASAVPGTYNIAVGGSDERPIED